MYIRKAPFWPAPVVPFIRCDHSASSHPALVCSRSLSAARPSSARGLPAYKETCTYVQIHCKKRVEYENTSPGAKNKRFPKSPAHNRMSGANSRHRRIGLHTRHGTHPLLDRLRTLCPLTLASLSFARWELNAPSEKERSLPPWDDRGKGLDERSQTQGWPRSSVVREVMRVVELHSHNLCASMFRSFA